MSMRQDNFSLEGLKELGKIVFEVKKKRNLSLRRFGDLVDVGHNTINRIVAYYTQGIDEDSNMPDYETLEKLAPHVGYTAQQLWDMAHGKSSSPDLEEKHVLAGQDGNFKRAEDVWLLAEKLPATEFVKLLQMMQNKIKTMDA